jgi:DNA-binding NarL/FixJ family response regulator
MPGINGLEPTQRIKKEPPMIQVVVLTIHENTEYRYDAFVTGASSFFPNHKMGTDLIAALSDLRLRLTIAFNIERTITWFVLPKTNVASQNVLLI